MTGTEAVNELAECMRNPRWYAEHLLTIRSKDGKLIPLKFNPAQEKLYEIIKEEHEAGRPVRIVILKARQLGFSTMIEALFFQDAATRRFVRTMIVSESKESATNLFQMNKLFYDQLPEPLKPMRKASNAKEIIFENPTKDVAQKKKRPGMVSSIKCVPATGTKVGRSNTLTNVHASEVAFWDDMDSTLVGLLQAVPDDKNTVVVLETTANGYNSFKDFWDAAMAGKNGFRPVFFPWYMEPGYRRPVPPDTEWSNDELQLKEAYGLDDEQLAWRRWCIATNLSGREEMFRQEYPSNPDEAFLMSGDSFFDNTVILARLERACAPVMRGRYVFEEGEGGKPENWQFVEDEKGEISIYERAKECFPYVAGGDTAGDGSDRFTAHMLDNTTGDQVAELLYDGKSELYYAQQLYCLGMDYGEALLGVEINFSTYPQKKLEEWGYPRLYIREKLDDSRGQLDTYKLGWRTDSRTRPLILAGLHALVKQTPDMIKSAALLREMLSFIRNSDMRPEAAPGMHDDLVMAAAIAHHIRPQQSFTESSQPVRPQEKLIDRIDPRHRHRR